MRVDKSLNMKSVHAYLITTSLLLANIFQKIWALTRVKNIFQNLLGFHLHGRQA